MVLVRNPLSSEEASGSVGGVVTFKTIRQSNTASRKSNCRCPMTAKQAAAQTLWASLARQWAALSPAEVSAWASLAASLPVEKMGQRVVLPAFDMFCLCSRGWWEYQSICPPANLTPLYHYELSLSLITPVIFPGQIRADWIPNHTVPDNWPYDVWIQGPLKSASRGLRRPEQRHVAYVPDPLLQYLITGLQPDSWYHVGVRLLPPGRPPTLYAWETIKSSA